MQFNRRIGMAAFAARKTLDAFDCFSTVFGGFFDHFERFDLLWISNLEHQQLGIAENTRQQIVEIVGYAAGQFAQRPQFFGKHQMLLRRF